MSDQPPSTSSRNIAPLRESEPLDIPSIPQPLTTFVGRDREISTVGELLRRPTIRLVTITGPGGVGKTRLALRVAEASRDDFEGIVFVPLAPVRDPAMLLPTVAQCLNVPDAPGTPVLSRLRAFLTPEHRLLVLDNVEHLLGAVPDLATLLANCPRLTLLCTSRTSLNLSGEHLLPLAPLSGDEARTLFVERMRALIPSFTVTEPLVSAVDAICVRLDRLPLAIELAAARVNVLPLPALLARLDHRLDLLSGGPRDAPPRLRDMRAAIAWSYDLLTQKEQGLFRRLGVFIGGFTLEAAAAVAGDDADTFESVSALASASLVVPTESRSNAPRYTMLETIRDYALEQLAASGEEAEVQRRHADYYRWLAEDALPQYDGPEWRIASERVNIELHNCRRAMAWALEAPAAETGLRLAGALWRVWSFQATGGKPWMDRVVEGQAWIERMLPMRDGLPVEALTEALLGSGGSVYFLRRDVERSQLLGEELLKRARAEGYPYGEFWALGLLGIVAEARGDVAAARSHFEHARALAPAVRNPDNHRAVALLGLGKVEFGAGYSEAAAHHLEEALLLCHETGNPWLLGDVAASLGRALQAQGQLGRVAVVMRQGLLAFADLGRELDVHAALVDLVRVALEAEQPVLAARLLGVAAAYPAYSASFPPLHQQDASVSSRGVADTQSRLGEVAYTSEFEAGRCLTWDEALAEIDALIETVVDATVASPPTPATAHGLSRRQVEVLKLITEGRSSREIAETLSLSERTIENHVFHIFTKLKVTSRAAAAAYAVRHGLTS